MRAGNQTTRMNNKIKVVARARAGNANHHLWNNHGTWWCHLTLHLPDYTKKRLRLSLGTGDVSLARRLRDSTLALFGGRVQPSTPEVA
jgi:hypothetical protein